MPLAVTSARPQAARKCLRTSSLSNHPPSESDLADNDAVIDYAGARPPMTRITGPTGSRAGPQPAAAGNAPGAYDVRT